ncbi:MAG: peptidase M4 [Candidatus Solibacter sp.]|jgi:hypothetical protein
MRPTPKGRPSNYKLPASRPLTVYAFDPTAGRRLNNYMTVAVPYEELQPGPVGSRIAVIDYDASNKCYYEPVDLDHPAVIMNGGLEPSESDPRFHQQMVYAVASETLRRFEFALGRRIKWRRKRGGPKDDPFRNRLRIFPHAFQQANAFYDPELRALCFGYFQAAADDPGDNLPNQTIFTCLSHDIIAHETTHALIDGLREYFTKSSHIDTPAFHEAFADIVALLQHFSMQDAVLDTINRTGGLIYKAQLPAELVAADGKAAIIPELSGDNPLVGLARQFGQAMGMRSALRSAIGTPPNTHDLDSVTEPHLRGSILVAAVFDAYFTVYIKRTRDLMRIARAGGALSAQGDLHPDLAKRLAREASKVASQFMNICVRAIDYCPPVDITFGEFLRALITADSDLVPEDALGYRGEIIKAFRLRGIIPENVSSYSEEALRWCSPEVSGRPVPPCNGLVYDAVEAEADEDMERAAKQSKANAVILTKYAKENAKSLGLTYTPNQEPNINAFSFHSIHRIAPDGRLIVDFVVEFLQKKTERLDPNDPKSAEFELRGGSTVIFNRAGEVRYVVEKSIGNQSRLESQREFHLQSGYATPAAAYQDTFKIPACSFAAIHRGY